MVPSLPNGASPILTTFQNPAEISVLLLVMVVKEVMLEVMLKVIKEVMLVKFQMTKMRKFVFATS